MSLRAVRVRVRNRLYRERLSRQVQVQPYAPLARLGTADDGYVLPGDLPQADWVCYSAGIGEDISFELELIARYDCEVIGFDPTPRSIEFMRGVALTSPRLRFFPIGLWSSDTEQRFHAPYDPKHVSHSITGEGFSPSFFIAQCRSLPSMMEELGHTHVDLLKLDVEGAEHEILESILDAGVDIALLLVEFHRVRSFSVTGRTLDRLDAAGYRPVHLDSTTLTLVDATLI